MSAKPDGSAKIDAYLRHKDPGLQELAQKQLRAPETLAAANRLRKRFVENSEARSRRPSPRSIGTGSGW